MHLVHGGGGGAALALVYLFIDAGRIEQSQVGLLSILLLALVTFTDSVRLGIRFSLVGVYLFIVAAIMSYIETFLWWMLLLSGIIVFFEVSLLRQKREQANRPDIEQ
jgi:Sec-independent protein secretion pathway component TatC